MKTRRALSSLSLALVAACAPAPAPPPADAAPAPATPPAVVAPTAELTAVRGPAGVRTPDLPDGAFLGVGARLRPGQRLDVPPGTLAELRLDDGTVLRLNEDTRLTVPTDRTLELEAGEVVVLLAAGQPPLRVHSGDDTLELRAGEARVRSRGPRRSHDVVHGAAHLRSGGRDIDLGPGAHLETPLAPDLPDRPTVSLRPLEETAWSRAFEVALADIDAPPPGVGSLTARRAGTSTTLHRLALTEQRVHVAIAGRIARTEVEQTFYNESGDVLEGTYRFPLPADASISGLSLLVGDKWMDAEMLEKQRARQIFRAIVDATVPRDPALLEWEQGNIFKMKIFPIPGRGARKIRLAYTQVLPAVGDTLRYRYPIAGASTGATGEEIGEFEFTVDVARTGLPEGAELVTPMARLERRDLPDHVELSTRASKFRPVHDLGVDVPLTADEQRVHAQTHLARDGQAYFMLALRPKIDLPATDRPVHYAFVLDRSHSMTPALWTVARGLVHGFTAGLGPDDRVTVLACDAACDAAPGGLAPAAAASPAVDAFLDAQILAGASDLGGMMRSAARALADVDPGAAAADRVIVYLGDGNASAGELAPDELLRHLERPLTGVRVEAVALGARSDLLALDALTRSTGGDLLRADARDDLRGVARELRLRAELPTARDVALTLPPGLVHVHPRRIAALRPGDTVLVTGKLAGPVRGAIELRATGPDGHVSSDSFEIDLAAAPAPAGASHPHLPRTWARLEIDDLTATRGHAARAEIVDLSRQYTVLSRYTALIALESDAMYREFNVARQAGKDTGPIAEPAADPVDPSTRPKTAEKRDLDDPLDGRDSDRATSPDAPVRDDDSLENRGAKSSTEDEPDLEKADRKSSAGDGPDIGTSRGGQGSGYGRGSGSGYGGGYGGRRGRLVREWTLGPAAAPASEQLEALRQAVLRDPTSRPAHRKLVQLAIRGGAADAFTYATAWSQADPDHAPALLAVADLLAARGDPIAVRAYGSAVEVDPFDARLHARLAEALAFKGDLARSCAHRRAVVSVAPARAEHHLLLVRCLGDLGDPELAREAAEDGLARARGDTSALRAALTTPTTPTTPSAPPSRPVTGDLTATATWTGDGDLDLAFIDPRGRRLSGLRREGVRVDQGDHRETLALITAGLATYAVEVTRFAGQGPITGSLQLRGEDQTRSFPFTIDQGSVRLASARLVERTVYDPDPHAVRQGEHTVQGGLERDIVRRIVRAHINEVRYCHAQALQRDPNARGKVTVRFIIDATGKVTDAAVRETTMKDATVGTCVAQAARRWTFPKPTDGADVIVTYPFLLGT